MEEMQQAAEQVLLKTKAIGGFDKKQVLSYIDQLREQNKAAQAELETRIEQMSAARSELAEQVGSFERKMTELEAQLEQRSSRIGELTGVIGGLKEELDRQRREKSDAERELAGQREQNRQLSLKANTSEYKAKRYDELSSQVGEVMIEAQKSAHELLSAAEEKASELQRDALSATEQVSGEITSLRGDLGAIRENLERAMRAFSERLDTIDGVIGQMEARRQACCSDDEQAQALSKAAALRRAGEALFDEEAADGDTPPLAPPVAVEVVSSVDEPDIAFDELDPAPQAPAELEEPEMAAFESVPSTEPQPSRSFFRRAAQA